MKKPLDLQLMIEPDQVATQISEYYQQWKSARNQWIEEKKELRNYVFATDTTTTSNSTNGWFNNTTTPKLTQIYDNLKANYTAALFPNSDWLRWEAGSQEEDTLEKRETIEAYMVNKLKNSLFENTMMSLVDDWVLFGNCFATVEWVEDIVEFPEGDTTVNYIGPRLVRISPYDITFNPLASSFENSPKIIRSVVSLGELATKAEEDPAFNVVFSKMLSNRSMVGDTNSVEKSDAFIADGFGSIQLYYSSGNVELLTFYGDLYDSVSGTLHKNRKITIADRAYIVSNEPIASWLGTAPIHHAGWRNRPDNLYSMGPLDNLVGLQYRIDHLENMRADVFDQIAFPILKIKGVDVEDFDYKPGTKIHCGEEGDVQALVPDATALNADFQIQDLQRKMEELAGAPSVSMGIRTPGEKTAFEVNTLQNAASRIFEHKAKQLERMFLEPVLNTMLESAVRNLTTSDTIQVFDNNLQVSVFETITKDDIKSSGKLRPRGASHFAERATRVQNLQNLQALKADPSVATHLSGKVVARMLAEELGEKELYGENIAVTEQLETQEAMQDAEVLGQENLAIAEEQGL